MLYQVYSWLKMMKNLNRGITFSLKKSGSRVFQQNPVKKKRKRLQITNNVDVTILAV